MLLCVVLFLLTALAQQGLVLAVTFGRPSYTGVVYRGNDVLVFNSSEGIELHVFYEQNTKVQYCEQERNETSDNATLTFYARQGGINWPLASLAGATQKRSGNVSLSETYIPYLISCDAGMVNFLGSTPGQIIANEPSPFLSATIFDCVNRTIFSIRTVPTPLLCTVPTPAPTFTPAPTIQALPGRDSGATDAHVSLFVSVVFVVIFLYFL